MYWPNRECVFCGGEEKLGKVIVITNGEDKERAQPEYSSHPLPPKNGYLEDEKQR